MCKVVATEVTSPDKSFACEIELSAEENQALSLTFLMFATLVKEQPEACLNLMRQITGYPLTNTQLATILSRLSNIADCMVAAKAASLATAEAAKAIDRARLH
jgi:hypothetical protein